MMLQEPKQNIKPLFTDSGTISDSANGYLKFAKYDLVSDRVNSPASEPKTLQEILIAMGLLKAVEK